METETAPRIPLDTFVARLKLARLHAGDLTIRQAADRCGLNYASWANWEKGIEPRGKDAIVEAISEGLGVDYMWLMRGGPLATEERRRPGRLVSRATSTREATLRNPDRRERPTPADERATPHRPGILPASAPEGVAHARHRAPTRPPGHAAQPTGPGHEHRTGRVQRPTS